MQPLTDIIHHAISQAGIISFADFMSLALYHREYGYYERATSYIGIRGDFFTSVSVGDLLGALLGAQFAGWQAVRSPSEWRIIEAGAHDGQLAKDILIALRDNDLATIKPCEYWILEPSPRRQARQQETLSEFEGVVRWFTAWESLPTRSIHGVIFANELLDAFPVHRLGWDAGQKTWFEWGVTVNEDRFVWEKMPLHRDHTLLTGWYLPPDLLEVLPRHFTLEVCPAANDWWREAARTLRHGHLLTLDYGLTQEQMLLPERAQGNLRAYYRHHISPNPLADPGEQDLTAPVNWTQLQATGESQGLVTEGLSTQAQFLTRIVQRLHQTPDRAFPWTPNRLRQFHTLTHPEHLGRAFGVLVQSRLVIQ